MSLKESKERLKNSRIEPESWSVRIEDIEDELAKIAVFGVKNCKLTTHLGRNEEGLYDLHYEIVPDDPSQRNGGDPPNASTTCPPDC